MNDLIEGEQEVDELLLLLFYYSHHCIVVIHCQGCIQQLDLGEQRANYRVL